VKLNTHRLATFQNNVQLNIGDMTAPKTLLTCALMMVLATGSLAEKLEDNAVFNGCLVGGCKELSLESSFLSGTIPSTIGLMTDLVTLTLYNNNLNGSLPAEIGNLTNLETLNLHHNYLSGVIPASIGELSSLKNMFLYVNKFSGQIPTEIGLLDKMISFFISSTKLTGTIPTEFGNMQQLVQFSLHNNRLTGSIPTELGQFCNSYNKCPIKAFYLSVNSLTGTLPPELDPVFEATKWSVCNNSLNTEAPAVTDEGVVYDSGVCTNLEKAASAGSLVSLTTGLLMSMFASVLALSA